MKKCNICGVEMQDTEPSPTLDCGGDCLSCMAEAGDTDCIELMYLFLKEENRDLRLQRDELLAALKSARQALAAASTRDPVFTDDYEAASALIARMEEGK